MLHLWSLGNILEVKAFSFRMRGSLETLPLTRRDGSHPLMTMQLSLRSQVNPAIHEFKLLYPPPI